MSVPGPKITYDKLVIAMRYYFLGAKMYTALDAMELMLQYQVGEGHVRDDGVTPEAQHPLEVAHFIRTLPDLLYREETLAAALLHDVPEDYAAHVSHASIKSRFGEIIHQAVYLVDKNGKTAAEHFEAMGYDPVASLVKGADRIRNNDTMIGPFSFDKIRRKIEETRNHILPMMKIARRKFPQQECAYELIAHSLCSQIDLLDVIVAQSLD